MLHERLAQRFHQMLAEGFLDEVRGLRERADLHAELPAVRAVGYRQLWCYLAGECRLETAVAAGIAATRQLAKRQLTWLRREPDVENVPMPPTVDWVMARLRHHRVQER